jgi:SAM-dependent methyltransferase
VNPASLERRDRWLEAVVQGLLHHDDRLCGADVRVRFDGGVAHVDGRVDDAVRRDHLRAAIYGLRGVHALWDLLVVGDRGPLRILDVGVGATKQTAGAVGLDRFPSPQVDVVADLRSGLPFASGSLDRVYAVHVLEHLVDLVPVMNDLHRVLADDGVLHVLSPHWRHITAVADPTHVSYLDVQTFKWFCTPHAGAALWHPLHAGYDGAAVFADLTPVRNGAPPPDEHLALFFD